MSNMNLDRKDRTQVFIDGPNLLSAMNSISLRIDYKRLWEYFNKHTRLVRVNYYATVFADDDPSLPIYRLLDYLSYNNYNVVRKKVRAVRDPDNGVTRIKGSVSVDLALAMVEAAETCDTIILFSGENDLEAAVRRAQDRGAHVKVVAIGGRSKNTNVGDDLIRACDEFIELDDLPDDFLEDLV